MGNLNRSTSSNLAGSRLMKIITIITAILIFISLYLIFGYAQTEGTMLEVQKIFYYHVSAALTVFVAFGVNCVFSLKYLIQRRPNDDLMAAAAAELGIIFCTVALLSGPIWARYAWNTWWNWEARLTSTLVLWLMYVGYFILRSALEGEKRRIYTAVLGIIAYLNVPIVYYAVDIWQGGLHPDRGTKWSLEPTMRYTWMVALLALMMLFTFLLIIRYRMKKTETRYEMLKQRYLEETPG